MDSNDRTGSRNNRTGTSRLFTKLKNSLENIKTLANSAHFFVENVVKNVDYHITELQSGVRVNIYLDENNYSGANYHEHNPDNPIVHSIGAGQYSTDGNRTGSLLFHLQLLLFESVSGAGSTFKLANMTDDPDRAAEGIYTLFKINKLVKDTGMPREAFKGQTPSEQLMTSSGEMILRSAPNLKEITRN